MILTASHLAELVREIAPLVTGLVIREVCARPPRDLLFVLEEPGHRDGPPAWRLLISADPDAPRVHLVRGRFERHEGPVGPFFRAVIADFAGLSVRAFTQVAHDRIVALEARGTEPRTLVAELVGRHSNLVVSTAGDRVAQVLVPPPADKERPRLVVGQVYVTPPGRSTQTSAQTIPLGDSLPAPRETAPLRRDETENRAPLSWLVEQALGAQATEAIEARARKTLEERAERKLKNARALVVGLEKKLASSAQFERVQQDGELLKASLASVKRGTKRIEVLDFYGEPGASRAIDLDPKLSANENLTRLFERAKKLERARVVVESELQIARARVAALEQLLAAAEPAGADHEALDREAVDRGLLDPPQEADPRKKKAPPARVPYKTFHGAAGAEIRVGRSAKDNDDLTFHHANGNDLWLHTAEAPGSHVVVKLDRNAEPADEDLLDAAHLAVHFSPLKDATRARVHVARRKEVHKPRGAKPGLVTLSGGKILEVRLQPERLRRLLSAHRALPTEGP